MKKEYKNIALSELRFQFYIVFLCCITAMVYIKTVVKIGNINVVLMRVLLSELMLFIVDQEIALCSKQLLYFSYTKSL